MQDSLTEVPGTEVGHVTDDRGMTGVTAIIMKGGAICSADVRGSNPGTFNIGLTDPLMANRAVYGICLSGGSLWGLAANLGVMRYLEERGIGVETRVARVPTVAGAVIYDLGVGDAEARPTAEDGYRAALAAHSSPVEQGNVGAGTGASCGKFSGAAPFKAGLGSASVSLPGGVVVGALAVVNAVGTLVHPTTGRYFATDGGFDSVPPIPDMGTARAGQPSGQGENTTLGVIATNARLDKTQLRKVAQMAHNAFARAIRPVHTMRDGDCVFALSVLEEGVEPPGTWWGEEADIIGVGAEDALLRALMNAALHAGSIPGFPSYAERNGPG
jgi:L-aminopeptidase/D-esterase-like protein